MTTIFERFAIMEQNYRPTMNDVLLAISRWKYHFGDENRGYDDLNKVYREVLGGVITIYQGLKTAVHWQSI